MSAVLQASGQLTGEWDMGGASQMYPSAARRTGQLRDLVQVPLAVVVQVEFLAELHALGVCLCPVLGPGGVGSCTSLGAPLCGGLAASFGVGLATLAA